MKDTANIVLKILNKKENKEKFILYYLIKEWTFLFGNITAKHSQPKKLERNVLFVHTDNSAWANNLLMMKVQLLDKINEAIPLEEGKKRYYKIKNIIFFQGKINDIFQEEKKEVPLEKVALNEMEKEKIKQSLSSMQNIELLAVCERLLLKDKNHKKNLLLRDQNTCPSCGVPIKKEEKFCVSCTLQEKKQVFGEIAVIIRSAPWINYAECNNLKKCGKIEFGEVKDFLSITALNKAIADDASDETKAFAVMLLKGLGPEEIDLPMVNRTIAAYKRRKDVYSCRK